MKAVSSQKRWPLPAVLAVALAAALGGFGLRPYIVPHHLPVVASPEPAVAPKASAAPAATPLPAPAGGLAPADLPALPPSHEAGEQTSAWLEKMAERDGPGAIKIAMTERNLKLREQLRDGVLRGWAKTDPIAAATWALHQDNNDDRLSGMYPVFEGAATHDPESAVALALKLYTESPNLPADYGNMAITMLAKHGAFETALQVALKANAIKSNASWANTALDAWAAYQPEAAAKALAQISDPDLHREGFIGLVTGWRAGDPAGLAVYANALPAGNERNIALQEGLVRWISIDPVAASAWADNLPPGPELDQVASAVAFVPTLIIGHPETALGWATSIKDPEMRANTLRALASQVAVRDIAAAQRLAASDLLADAKDKSAFVEGIHEPPHALE